jgi:hypothetical protein
MTADGFGLERKTPDQALWTAVRPGARMTLARSGSAAFVLRLEAAIPLSKLEVVIAGSGTVHRAGPVALRASAGFELLLD